jgi:lipopolysaccharide transport system ATP-binding protein
MSAIVVNDVWKRYLIGQARYSSLRDALAGAWRRLSGGAAPPESARRREFYALKGINLRVERGAVLGVIGPNGAGKSTLLKLLSRVTQPTRGTVSTEGRLSALIEVGAGFHPELTGRENVYLNGSILGMTRREVDAKFDAIVDFSGLATFIDTPVKYYSSGMFARLGFSVAAHVEPDILLVDEVLSVGDFGFQQKCLERMRRIVQSGATVVFVSHNLPAVTSLCEEVLLLHEGEIAAQGDPAETVSQYHQLLSTTGSALRGTAGAEGAAEARFVFAEFADESGKATASFNGGRPFRLRVGVRFETAQKAPVLVLQVRNTRGVGVFRTDTRAAGAEIGPVQSGSELTVELGGTMNLLEGHYIVRAILETGDHERVLAASDALCSFSVLGDGRAQGIADLGFEMTVRPSGRKERVSDDVRRDD